MALHSSPGFAWVELGGKIAHGGHGGKHLWRTCIVVRWCETETSESERAFFMLARDEEWVYRHNVCGRQEGRGEEGKTVEFVGKPNFAS